MNRVAASAGARRGSGAILSAALLAAAVAAAASAASAQPPATPPPATIAGLVHVCSSCHGPGGYSISSTFPRLAGQQKNYLEVQLQAFRDHTRADPHAKTYMWGMAARLTNAQIDAIAGYFSSQPAVRGRPSNSPLVAEGRKIFTEGVAAEHVPACGACHGDKGQGLSAFPRLAGQHRDYIERELRAFAAKRRNNPIMHANSKNLTEEQIRALAAYVRTLN